MALHAFARNTFFATIAGCSAALGSFVGTVIVARLLGPAGAGAVALALWIVSTSVAFCDLGLPVTVSRFLPDLNARGQRADAVALGRVLFPSLLMTTALGATLAVALFIFRGAIDRAVPGILPFEHLSAAIWLAIGVGFCTQAIGAFAICQLRGEQRFDFAAKLSLMSFGAQIAGVGLGGYFFQETGAVLGFACGGLVPTIFAIGLKPGQGKIDAALRRRAWSFALNSWGANIVSAIVWSRSELAFLSYWRGHEEAGYYAIGITLSLLAAQAPLLMTGGMLALFSERYARGDHEGLERAFASAMRFMALMLFPACFGMAAITPVLLPVFFGVSFKAAVPVSALLIAAQAFASLSTVTSVLLFATERSRILVKIGIWGALALVIAGFTIIPAYGLMVTAATRGLIQISLVGAAAFYIQRTLRCRLPTLALARIFTAAVACAAAARLVLVVVPSEVGLFIAVPIGCLVYFLCIRLFRALPEDDIARLRSLASRLPARIAAAAQPLLRFLGAPAEACARAE